MLRNLTLATSLFITATATPAHVSGGEGGENYSNAHDVVVARVSVVGANPLGLTASFDENTKIITVAGRPYDDVRMEAYGPLTARGARLVLEQPALKDLAIYGETSSGSGTVVLASMSPTLGDFEAVEGFSPLFADVLRRGTTSAPTTGSVEYTGRYLGSRFMLDANTILAMGEEGISGDITLTAEFGETITISGTVTNRKGGDELEWANISLEFEGAPDGSFSGTVTGGERVGQSTFGGIASGLLTGADASEALGGLSILHRNGELEAGVFVLDYSTQ